MNHSEIVDELLSITQISSAEMTARKNAWGETKQRLARIALALGGGSEAGKESSSEMSSLAGKVLNESVMWTPETILHAARRLAGSVLSQDETPQELPQLDLTIPGEEPLINKPSDTPEERALADAIKTNQALPLTSRTDNA